MVDRSACARTLGVLERSRVNDMKYLLIIAILTSPLFATACDLPDPPERQEKSAEPFELSSLELVPNCQLHPHGQSHLQCQLVVADKPEIHDRVGEAVHGVDRLAEVPAHLLEI